MITEMLNFTGELTAIISEMSVRYLRISVRKRFGNGRRTENRVSVFLRRSMLEFGFKSDTGKVRSINQDAFFVMPDEKIFLVADGVGGHNNGELASRTVMADIAGHVKENPRIAAADDPAAREYFESLIRSVNGHIYEMAKKSTPGGMATTLVALYLSGDKALAANVGDSRLYLIRNGEIRQITEDHTYVNDLMREGIITREQARNHPDRNMITRAMGAEADVRPDLFVFDVQEKDVLLLCTDGLYNEVPEEEICRVLSGAGDMRTACALLVNQANEHGGADNITAVSVRL